MRKRYPSMSNEREIARADSLLFNMLGLLWHINGYGIYIFSQLGFHRWWWNDWRTVCWATGEYKNPNRIVMISTRGGSAHTTLYMPTVDRSQELLVPLASPYSCDALSLADPANRNEATSRMVASDMSVALPEFFSASLDENGNKRTKKSCRFLCVGLGMKKKTLLLLFIWLTCLAVAIYITLTTY